MEPVITSIADRIAEPTGALTAGRFIESSAKLYRAHCHAHEVSRWWEWAVERHNAAIQGGDVNLAYDLSENLLRVRPPVEVALAIGDCIRNLRSALDYLPSRLARDAGLPDNHTIFPFHERKSGIEASFKPPETGDNRKGRRAGALYDLSRRHPELERLIFKVIQPYSADDGAHASGDLIWRLITSDNIDKHRLMTPTVDSSGLKNVKVGGVTFEDVAVTGNAIAFGPGMEVHPESRMTANILFQEPARLAGKPVTSTLIAGCHEVAKIIKVFDENFPGP